MSAQSQTVPAAGLVYPLRGALSEPRRDESRSSTRSEVDCPSHIYPSVPRGDLKNWGVL